MRILLFAHLKDIVGQSELDIDLPLDQPLNADDLWQRLIARYPELNRCRPSVRLAKNGEYANNHTTFTNTDDVALIPPVSGG
jgi:MoaE-MoaD fusion protein